MIATKTKWEYCAIKSNLGVKYFDPDGNHKVDKYEGENKDFHASIGKLGQEGWELVSLAPLPDGSAWVYYFKRPEA